MGQYLDRIDAAGPADRWPLVRQFMMKKAQPFFGELRAERPVLELPELTFVSRYADCALILHRFRDFGVDLYRPKQGDYFMAQDDTTNHWRDKAVVRSILDFEQLPAMRAFVATRTAAILDQAGGTIDAPAALTRAVPVALVQQFFGFGEADPAQLTDWSYWSQQDAFHNQSFDHDVVGGAAREIEDKRAAAKGALAQCIGGIAKNRATGVPSPQGAADPVVRLMKLSQSGAIDFPMPRAMANVAGLLVGSVETTSHSVNNALIELFARPAVLAAARAAAAADDPAVFDGYVWEALRLNPPFPYFFRVCHAPTLLAGGTPHAREVQPGTVVLAAVRGAMLDEAAYARPTRFDPRRTAWQTFIFGYGEHECLGRAVANAMLPEIVRQLLRRPGLRADGPVKTVRGVPEHYVLRYDA